MPRTLTVLGAGIAGLAAGRAARDAGHACVLYEAASRAGGLVDSFTVQDYRFDQAVHLSFADQPEVRAIFDPVAHSAFRPQPRCVDHPHWITYPVQHNLHALPVEERIALVAGFVERPDIEVRTYRDWLVRQFGEPLSRRFPERYTEKYWTVPAQQMGTAWIGSRIPRLRLDEVLRGAMTADTPSVYPIAEMRYPRIGGYAAFIQPLLEQADIRLDHRLIRLEPGRRRLHFANGQEAHYEALLSTLPMPVLVNLVEDVPSEVRQAADSLEATTVDLVSIGIAKPDVFQDLWFYIYDDDVLAARASCPGAQSPDNCPPGCSSIQFEIYGSSRRPPPDVEAMKRNCVEALRKWGFADPVDIALVHHRRLPFGNVIFDSGMEERRDLVRSWLAGVGILGAGRFGEWDYLWSHQAFESGQRAARQALGIADALA